VGLYFLPWMDSDRRPGAGNRRRRPWPSAGPNAVTCGRRRPIVTPSAAAAAIVGDSSATVRYLRPDGSWVDSSGSPLDGPAEDRRLLPVVDAAGEVVAGIDVDGSRTVPPLLADLAVSTVALRAANERAAALADSRRREVRARSRELVTATDRGRIDLERNLHDGAQQLLVGLALTVGLRARGSGPDTGARSAVSDIDEVVRQVRQIRHDVLTLVDSTTPAALTLGLVGALGSLAAVYPVSTTLESVGDLPADDPVALGLYLAAGEIVTNAVKHSTATRVDIGLNVGTDEVRLSVADNGIGGVAAVPAAVADRVRTFHGHAQIDSPVGGGHRRADPSGPFPRGRCPRMNPRWIMVSALWAIVGLTEIAGWTALARSGEMFAKHLQRADHFHCHDRARRAGAEHGSCCGGHPDEWTGPLLGVCVVAAMLGFRPGSGGWVPSRNSPELVALVTVLLPAVVALNYPAFGCATAWLRRLTWCWWATAAAGATVGVLGVAGGSIPGHWWLHRRPGRGGHRGVCCCCLLVTR